MDRGGSFSSQIRAAPSSEKGKSISLIDELGTFGTLIVEAVLELKIVGINFGNNDCVLVTLGGCLEQFRHSSIISHQNFWWRIFQKLVFKKWELNPKRFNNNVKDPLSKGPPQFIRRRLAKNLILRGVIEYPDAPLFKDRVSDNKDCSIESPVVVEKKIVVSTIAKVEVVRPKQQEKPVNKIVRYAEMYRSQGPRENHRNWNNLKSQQLGSDFVMYNNACFVYGSFDHL
nr:hypothetical protein [Tanacetum cinerariifolium]